MLCFNCSFLINGNLTGPKKNMNIRRNDSLLKWMFSHCKIKEKTPNIFSFVVYG